MAVPEVAPVADVRQCVPVGAGLDAEVHRIVVRAELAVRLHRLVDLDHPVLRVDAAWHEAELWPVLVERDPEAERLPRANGRRTASTRRIVDQVDRADLVVGTPTPPLVH